MYVHIPLSFLEAFTKGDKPKMIRYVQLYLKMAPDSFDSMAQSLEDRDWEQMRIHAHSLKPQADYVGIASLKETLIEIEDTVKTGNHDRLKVLLEKALQIHSESAITLQDFVNNP